MHRNLSYIIVLMLLTGACKKSAQVEETPAKARVSVDVASLTFGNVKDELSLSASTLYLSRNVVTSPIPAFITKVYIKLGDGVREGQTLYELESKERRALGKQTILSDSALTTLGKISVKAPATGIITTLDKQQLGDYVLEGTQLCTLAENGALAFAVNVPYEYSTLAKPGMRCTLTFPDNTVHEAKFTTPLTTMNALAQTQTILAKSVNPVFLPENLIVKVKVNKITEKPQQVLPKDCVLSDEMLQNFWVMKLTSDSIAVKIPVTIGSRSSESVEILHPAFNRDDKFLITGNYGLPDTAYVKVNHQP